MTQPSTTTPSRYGEKNLALSNFMSKVYTWMTIGILISGVIAYYIGSNAYLMAAIVGNHFLFYGLIIAQLGCVFGFRSVQRRCTAKASIFLYLLYSLLTGITFSVILFVYTEQSIAQAFIATAGSFGALSLFGYVTKRDLGPVGTFCYMGLIGLIIVYVLGFFFPSMMSGSMSMILGAVGVLVFAGLTAYDTQKIKQTFSASAPVDVQAKMVINGALMLYLDFINLFLSMLRLFGGRR